MPGYRIQVTVVREGRTPYNLEFEHFPVTIGSLVDSDVVLDHPAVSRKHALVTLSHGKPLFVDQSSNGSYLRQKRISRQVLEDEDIIYIFPFQLRFSLEVSASPEQTNLLKRTVLFAGSRTEEAAGDAVDDAEERGQPILRIAGAEDDEANGELKLTPGSVIIGRGDDVDLVVSDETVSRSHARLTWRVDGSFWLEDLDSSNGTYVNKTPIRAGSVQPGDRIQLGTRVSLELCLEGSKSSGASQDVFDLEDASSSVVLSPALKLSSRRPPGANQVLIFAAAGRLDGYTYTKLTEAFDRAVDQGERNLVIDLSAVEFVDHAGLGALVKAVTTLDGLGGQLRLIGLSQRLRQAFTLSRLDSVFRNRICKTEEKALAELGRRSSGGGWRGVQGD